MGEKPPKRARDRLSKKKKSKEKSPKRALCRLLKKKKPKEKSPKRAPCRVLKKKKSKEKSPKRLARARPPSAHLHQGQRARLRLSSARKNKTPSKKSKDLAQAVKQAGSRRCA